MFIFLNENFYGCFRMDVFDKLLIGTDSEEIAEICGRFGACVELTGSEHSCGTERVAEVANKKDYKKYELVINIQTLNHHQELASEK